MSTFKPGDKVYCPLYGSEIFVLEKSFLSDYDVVLFSKHRGNVAFTNDGKYFEACGIPILFHATVENHKLLEALYGVPFEKPKRKLKGSALCKHLLKTRTHVFCRVSNLSDEEASATNARIRCIVACRREVGFTFEVGDSTCATYNYAVPINPDTLEPLEMEADE